MIQETIKAVKEAEAKAQQKIKDASVRAQSIISEAEKEAENIIRKAETAAGEQAASDMKAAEERAHSTENTGVLFVIGQKLSFHFKLMDYFNKFLELCQIT